MFYKGSKIPLRDLHLTQDLRKLHYNKSKTVRTWEQKEVTRRGEKKTTDGNVITNQKAAKGVVIHTGRKVEEAGHSGGSYQE